MPTTKKIHYIWDDTDRGDQLDPDIIDRIDTAAGQLVEAVHAADPSEIERILVGMSWRHLAALAVSVASIAEPARPGQRPESMWSIPDLKACHAAFNRGIRDDRVRRGEVLYQQWRYRDRTSQERETA